MSAQLNEILKLSVAERIQLVEDIWDSVAASPDSVPLTTAQCDELDRRLADLAENPGDHRFWDELKQDILMQK